MGKYHPHSAREQDSEWGGMGFAVTDSTITIGLPSASDSTSVLSRSPRISSLLKHGESLPESADLELPLARLMIWRSWSFLMTKSRRDSGVLNGVTGTLVSQTVPTRSQIRILLPWCELRQGSPMDTAEPLESPVKTDYEVTSPRRPRYARPQEGNEEQSHSKISHRRSPKLASCRAPEQAAEHLVESLRLHTRQSYRAGNAGPCNPRGQSACRSFIL